MCGIAGAIGFSDKERIAEMLAAMRHRGPDDEGAWAGDDACLGMVRLSVIDREGGRQPMRDASGRYTLVFNGEIYNYRELRDDLAAAGETFVTRSDTEVLLVLYRRYGAGCLARLNGDFAFAVWDAHEKTLFAARDRLGVKPLFYWSRGGILAFASELKALVRMPGVGRALDRRAVNAFFTFLYVPGDACIIEGVRKLPPGCMMTARAGEEPRVQRYWDLPPCDYQARIAPADAAERLTGALEAAVRRRLVSDVPLGVFLSGGLDSGSIACFMSRAPGTVRSFSIGFDGGHASYNETPVARAVAKAFGADHREFLVNPSIVELLPQVVWHMDEPFADSSALITCLISREARKHVTVALTGIGGDEVFGGYPRYLGARLSTGMEPVPMILRRAMAAAAGVLPDSMRSDNPSGRLKRFLRGCCEPRDRRYLGWMSFSDAAARAALLGRAGEGADFDAAAVHRMGAAGEACAYADQVNRLDMRTYLPDDLLTMGDRMSMAHGLELRVPFCDHELVEAALAIPLAQRMEGFRLKGLLKRGMAPLLPAAVTRQRKQGFMVPLGAWLRGELGAYCRDILSPQALKRGGVLDPAAVGRFLDGYGAPGGPSAHFIYALLVFELWRSRNLDVSAGQ